VPNLARLIDELVSKDIDMWNNQEMLYEIRRMSFQEYKLRYFSSHDGAIALWTGIKKLCDLNAERNQLIDDVDKEFVKCLTRSEAS
jgi:hypothetical protein